MLQFSLFNIPIRIHWMFWLLAAFIGGGLSALDSGNPQALALVLVFMLAATISIIVHELGHALSGIKLGAPRVEIFLHGMGGLASFPGGQFDRKQRILMTAAGPGASIALGFVSAIIASFALGTEPPTSYAGAYVAYFFEVMVTINFFWAIVNLMPVLPLDGGQIVYSLLGPQRVKTTCIISFITVAILAFLLWTMTHSIFNMVIMAFLASHTFQVWKANQ